MNTSHAQRSLSFLPSSSSSFFYPFLLPIPSFSSLLNHLLYHPFIPQRFISYTHACETRVYTRSCARFSLVEKEKEKGRIVSENRGATSGGSRVIRADLRREESQPKESVQRDYIEARNIPIPRKIRRRPHVSHTAIPAALCQGEEYGILGAPVCAPVRVRVVKKGVISSP